MACRVELLSIGNELLLGNTVNTNASWIATRVTKLGGAVTRITTVGDNLKDISGVITQVLKRKPDFLITTGGIGPTFDDMTLNAVAKALHVSVRVDHDALEMIRKHYAARFPGRDIKITKARLKMARLPLIGKPVPNPKGTAPGVVMRKGRTTIVCLPGVPREAKAIFNTSLAKMIRASAQGMEFFEKWIDVKGIMESTLSPFIDKVMRKYPGVYVKSHPRGIERGIPHIQLHFSTTALRKKLAKRKLKNAVEDFLSLLPERSEVSTRLLR